MVLLVKMHLIKGTYIIFSCGQAGYRAIPIVDWYQYKMVSFQWFYRLISISLRGRVSIGTNGRNHWYQ